MQRVHLRQDHERQSQINIVGSTATTVNVPVPEPSTAMLALGAIGAMTMRRRRAR